MTKGLTLSALAVACLLAAAQATTVWLIPHSHCDVGWLKTIDEYYEQEVRHVYNTVFTELPKDPSRRFIIVEMAFFSMWWSEATQEQKDVVYASLENNQIEFVIGGWSMNDDAGPTYSASTNQLTDGHAWLREHFDVTPRLGWQIDPFGLSSYYPTMNAMMGFNAHVINRIHYALKDEWKASKHLEFLWRGSNSLGEEVQMFTHILDSHYSFPSGFNFEKDAPITDSNIASKAQTLVTELQKRANWYLTEHLLVPGGDDFRWQNAAVQYENWDKLISYINERNDTYGLTIRYATLSEYFNAVAQEDVEWPVYTSDFFPYADNAESYWTGFFTTHSDLKHVIRDSQALSRTTELFAQAAAVEGGIDADDAALLPMRYAQAEAQHHDGVTGTSKMHVVDMYHDHLADGRESSEPVQAAAFAALLGGAADANNLGFDADALLDLTTGNAVPIVVSNTLGWDVHTVHSATIPRADVAVLDADGLPVTSQIIPVADQESLFELLFPVQIPAAGYRVFYLIVDSTRAAPLPLRVRSAETITNDEVTVNYDIVGDNVNVNITQRSSSTTTAFSLRLYEYTSYTGSGQKSGAYIFRPTGPATGLTITSSERFTGDLADEVRVYYGSTHVAFLRVLHEGDAYAQRAVELSYRIGVLAKDREAIVRYVTDLDTSSVRLISDNNGIERRERPRELSSLLQANYYPMVMQSHVRDTERSLTFFVDRTVGVGSQAHGEIEMMLHRRCSYDDGRGMGEPLDDDTVVQPRFILLADSVAEVERFGPVVNLRHQYRTRSLFTQSPVLMSQWVGVRSSYSFLRAPLPLPAHLMTVKVDVGSGWSSAVLRVQNVYEAEAGMGDVDIDVSAILNTEYLVSEELELTATQPLATVDRIVFDPHQTTFYGPMTKTNAVATFRPMDIRTYRVYF